MYQVVIWQEKYETERLQDMYVCTVKQDGTIFNNCFLTKNRWKALLQKMQYTIYMYCKVRWNGLNQYLFDKLVFDKCIDANNVLTTFYVEMFI